MLTQGPCRIGEVTDDLAAVIETARREQERVEERRHRDGGVWDTVLGRWVECDQ